jgi:plasmid replication initiation protein
MLAFCDDQLKFAAFFKISKIRLNARRVTFSFESLNKDLFFSYLTAQ